MKKEVVHIVSDVDRAIGFENMCELLGDEFRFTFILLNKNDSYMERYCMETGIGCHRIEYRGKKDILSAFLKIYRLLKRIRPQIVHTHLLDPSLAGLTAAKLAGIGNRIHSRHHSDFHHVYFPHAVRYDKYINRNSKKIVAVSPNVRNILIEKEEVDPKKIETIYHGFRLSEFVTVSDERIRNLKDKYIPPGKSPVIGVVSRYTEWKGIQYIIPAFRELLKEKPDAFLILANAQGAYEPEVHRLLTTLPAGSYREIAFETDLHALFRLFDVFVHVPVTETAEAFGQVYIESLLSKVPMVCTRSGIATEFPSSPALCRFVDFSDPDMILSSVRGILGDRLAAQEMCTKAYSWASASFSHDRQLEKLRKVYEEMISNS